MLKAGSKRAQSVLEYSLVIACVVVALLTMSRYTKRSLQGKFHRLADELGQQYEPRKTTGTTKYTYNSNSTVWAKTMNEKELKIDLNDNGALEDEVYGSTTNTSISNAVTTHNRSETVNVQ